MGQCHALRDAVAHGSFGVNAWTVDNPLLGRALLRLGVDGIVTDRSGAVPFGSG
ncbi:glycerophosphodiester phosphodiesterase family protein [Natronoarchaeum philippinense]|uniref:glycerophosphodiester phosphodiesterase family protein n=1 Tax=Natronoarchaeum philippinense TaxID=558529 RepID=UPI0015CA6129|nr:glycerophosphodiester phosphodiesterase family protein [Natronoarchaeum philippinense]